jgi:pantoate--beta-alanine ligase
VLPVLTTPAAMRQFSDDGKRAGRRIGLVPTMGALHAGHLALVAEAQRHADLVVVSIFVNPLQFNRRDDFEQYPRPIDDDVARCRAAGVDAVYAPTAAVMYPDGFQTHVEPGPLAEPLEGAGRPGHFRGVTTVVTKLFGAVQPHVAVFGQKDFQQLAVVRRMCRDLDFGVDIVGLPTVREPDGLALSSRNVRLTAAQRAAAVCVPAGLRAAQLAATAGERDSGALLRVATEPVHNEPMARLEYCRLVDPDTLTDLVTVEEQAVLVAAVWFGEVRLIDNVLIER